MKRKLLPRDRHGFRGLVGGGGSPAQAPKKSGASLTGIVLGKMASRSNMRRWSANRRGGSSPRVMYTDANGRFTITGLRQDNYDLRGVGERILFGLGTKYCRAGLGRPRRSR